MKKINEFLNEEQSNKSIQYIFGGQSTIKDTGAHMGCGVYEDTWDDKDRDGKFSKGDTLCFNSADPECEE